jgi:hypothetical protein
MHAQGHKVLVLAMANTTDQCTRWCQFRITSCGMCGKNALVLYSELTLGTSQALPYSVLSATGWVICLAIPATQ